MDRTSFLYNGDTGEQTTDANGNPYVLHGGTGQGGQAEVANNDAFYVSMPSNVDINNLGNIYGFYRAKQKAINGIYFDMVFSFMYFIFNPWYLFYSCFNLLFGYIGLTGIKQYDLHRTSIYAIYATLKILGMISGLILFWVHYGHNYDNSKGFYTYFSIIYSVTIIAYSVFLLYVCRFINTIGR